MTATRTLFLLLTITLFSAPALAVDKYDVELVIFERTSRAAAMNESWPEDPGKPNTEDATHLTSNGAYAKLPNSRRSLISVAKRMRRASGKPVRLTHMIWRQPAVGKLDAIPVYVSGKTRTGVLTGTAKVHVKRYLHIDLDLLLETTNGPEPGLFRMQAHRRMRSGKLHYIDHPIMGALVRITPVK
jgi:hypothetical protein